MVVSPYLNFSRNMKLRTGLFGEQLRNEVSSGDEQVLPQGFLRFECLVSLPIMPSFEGAVGRCDFLRSALDCYSVCLCDKFGVGLEFSFANGQHMHANLCMEIG